MKEDNKKNVILLIPNLDAGGAERVVSNLSQRFPEDIRVHIVLHDARKITYEYKGELIDLGVDFRRDIHLIGGILLASLRLKKIKELREIHTTVSFLSQSHHINVLSQILGGREEKIILSVRNNQSRKFRGSLYGIFAKAFIKLFYGKAHTIVTLSEGVKRDLVDNFGIDESMIKTIYNPCDTERIRFLSKEGLTKEDHRSIFGDGPILVNVGSLNEQKGQWHLLRAFAKVREEVPGVKLAIFGEGRYEGYLKKLRNDLGLNDCVFFMGYQKNPFKFLSRSDVFVLSSLFEGFGNVITEAMACGLPIISADCESGPREILAPGTDLEKNIKEIEYADFGILTPVCDGERYGSKEPLTHEERELAKAMIHVLRDGQMKERYRKLAMTRVQDFDLENIVGQWVDIL